MPGALPGAHTVPVIVATPSSSSSFGAPPASTPDALGEVRSTGPQAMTASAAQAIGRFMAALPVHRPCRAPIRPQAAGITPGESIGDRVAGAEMRTHLRAVLHAAQARRRAD
jgi:hypothetical protein